MKKLPAVVLMLMLLFGCVGCAEETVESQSDLYGEVLANYYDIIADPQGRTEFTRGEFGVFEQAVNLGDAALDTLGYVLTDLNGDGTEELLVGDFSPTEEAHIKNYISAIYTHDGKQPALLLEGSTRNRYFLMEGGSLLNQGSGSAVMTIFGECRLTKDGAIEWVDYYYTDATDDAMTEIAFFHNTEGVVDNALSERLDMDEETFWGILEAYQGRTVKVQDTRFAQLTVDAAK